MSENTEKPDPIAALRARLGELEPNWSTDDFRDVFDRLDETETKYRRLCTAMANGQQTAQDILDSRNALVRVLRQAQALTGNPARLATFIIEVTDQLFSDDQTGQAAS